MGAKKAPLTPQRMVFPKELMDVWTYSAIHSACDYMMEAKKAPLAPQRMDCPKELMDVWTYSAIHSAADDTMACRSLMVKKTKGWEAHWWLWGALSKASCLARLTVDCWCYYQSDSAWK